MSTKRNFFNNYVTKCRQFKLATQYTQDTTHHL